MIPVQDIAQLMEAKRQADAVKRGADDAASSAYRALENELERRQVIMKVWRGNTQAKASPELYGPGDEAICLVFSVQEDQQWVPKFTIQQDSIAALRDFLNQLLPPAAQAEISSTA